MSSSLPEEWGIVCDDLIANLQAGQIIDDDLNNWLVNPLPEGVVLHCVIDACHSGSVMDLPYRSKIKYGKPVWKNEYTAPTKRWKVWKTIGVHLGFQRDHA